MLALALAVPLLQGQNRNAVDQLLNRIVQHEQEFLRNLRAHSPIIETYIQEMPVSDLSDSLPIKDHYFLGRMSLTDVVSYESFLNLPTSRRARVFRFPRGNPLPICRRDSRR